MCVYVLSRVYAYFVIMYIFKSNIESIVAAVLVE